MKQRLITNVIYRVSMALVVGVFALSGTAFAADNTGTGDIGGVGASLADSNTFTLNTRNLNIVKTAFLNDNATELTSGSSIPAGTQVRFLIYVNNNTPIAVNDVSIQDVLNTTTFNFATGDTSIRVGTTAACAADNCTNVEEAALMVAVAGTGALTDAVDGDVASWDGTDTVNVGDQNAANATLNIPANTAWAVSIYVTMQ